MSSVETKKEIKMDQKTIAVSNFDREDGFDDISTAALAKMEHQENVTLTLLNNIGQMEAKPVVKLVDLVVGKPYEFLEVKPVKTAFQERAIVVEMEDFVVYLPKRFEQIKSEELQILNAFHSTLYFVCNGSKEVKVGQPTSLVQFVKRDSFLL